METNQYEVLLKNDKHIYYKALDKDPDYFMNITPRSDEYPNNPQRETLEDFQYFWHTRKMIDNMRNSLDSSLYNTFSSFFEDIFYSKSIGLVFCELTVYLFSKNTAFTIFFLNEINNYNFSRASINVFHSFMTNKVMSGELNLPLMNALLQSIKEGDITHELLGIAINKPFNKDLGLAIRTALSTYLEILSKLLLLVKVDSDIAKIKFENHYKDYIEKAPFRCEWYINELLNNLVTFFDKRHLFQHTMITNISSFSDLVIHYS